MECGPAAESTARSTRPLHLPLLHPVIVIVIVVVPINQHYHHYHRCCHHHRRWIRSTPLKNGGDHSFGSRFGPLRNRPPVFWCHFLESWRQDGENREKTRKNGAKMGEIWPKKKSAGRRSIIEGSVRAPFAPSSLLPKPQRSCLHIQTTCTTRRLGGTRGTPWRRAT